MKKKKNRNLRKEYLNVKTHTTLTDNKLFKKQQQQKFQQQYGIVCKKQMKNACKTQKTII